METTDRRSARARATAKAKSFPEPEDIDRLSVTEQMLLTQYGQPVIALARIVPDYFPELTIDTFLRRHAAGEIALKVTRLNPGSQKATRFVYLRHLADFIDARAAVAVAG